MALGDELTEKLCDEVNKEELAGTQVRDGTQPHIATENLPHLVCSFLATTLYRHAPGLSCSYT